eukprot:1159496-Pelagomonas_calceolata.AAC.1
MWCTFGTDANCDAAPLTAQVRFTCMKDVKDSIIFSVNEFPTCNYVFVVATPFLCKHPEFKPQPPYSQAEVQRVTGVFRSARKTLTNLSGLPDLPFKILGFG